MFSKWKNKLSSGGRSLNPFSRLPLTLKITGWYSIFLLLMLLMLSVFILQFTQLWEASEMRSTLQSRVINTADNLTRFRPFQEGVLPFSIRITAWLSKGSFLTVSHRKV